MSSYRKFEKAAVMIFLVTIVAPVANAQRTKRAQWEYCAITKSITIWTGPVDKPNLKARSVTSICYFQSAGCRQEDLKFEVSIPDIKGNLHDPHELSDALEKASEVALAKAVVKLGEDGWEMVGEVSSMVFGAPNERAIYFKRRK